MTHYDDDDEQRIIAFLTHTHTHICRHSGFFTNDVCVCVCVLDNTLVFLAIIIIIIVVFFLADSIMLASTFDMASKYTQHST